MMNSSLSGIVSKFLELREEEEEFVLATIIGTQGSTYRKAGARLLITRNGKYFGLLGGGCFEADLLDHVAQVFEHKQTETVYYDMRGPEDLVWGLGLGCNGAVNIRLEYLSTKNDFAPLSTIKQGLDLKQRCVIATVCESKHPTLLSDQHYLINFERELTDAELLPVNFHELAIKTLYSDDCTLQTIELDGHRVEVFMAPVIPPVELMIIGGGPDSIPVINTANLLGWSVSLVDYREAYSKAENFPDNIRVIKSTPEELIQLYDLNTVDAVVLMTHKYEYDLRYLKNFIDSKVSYIGLLGPTARKNELLRSLDTSSAEFLEKVYGPVGLNIGGELPEEIALSLVAEIQAVLRNRQGGHLTGVLPEDEHNNSRSKLSVIILAAGGSSRFGALKQLLEYNGKSLLKHSVEKALQLDCNEVLVIHGPKATKCQREISGYDVINIVNNEWETGMASSLVIAIRSVSSDSNAAMVLLCDQPLIDNQHLEKLIDLWGENPEKIVAAEYADTIGVPAVIPRNIFDEVIKLKGDDGARKIISTFSEMLVTTSIPEAEFDIDTEKDFSELLLKKPA